MLLQKVYVETASKIIGTFIYYEFLYLQYFEDHRSAGV